ncbi:PPE family protein [Mycolicibacter icosiumassiliensis]|uniref:PPE family protein n=1 Tax=Mycolicibacter icosiumassiliensis TaxID=1792835 RepID=UPI001F1EA8C3|nr:PPE family protein [Mycolicibacter icosiumassiliensis]
MALPPEAHATLLSAGPGPSSLLAAAAAWNALGNEYRSTTTELAALLSAVQAGSWQGVSAERYLAANTPYLAWLSKASADTTAIAGGHEVAASAYSTALATMPTLGELAANHVTHAVLLVTNFFGINAIPIALNESDYERMWILAATTMSTYQTICDTVVAAAPPTAPAPRVLKPGANTPVSGPLSSVLNSTSIWQQLIQFLQNPLPTLQQILTALQTDPVAALDVWGPTLTFIVAYVLFVAGGILQNVLELASPLLLPILLPPLLGMVAPAAVVAETLQEPLHDRPVTKSPATAIQSVTEAQTLPAVVPAHPSTATPSSIAGASSTAAPAPSTPASAAAPAYLVHARCEEDPGSGFGPTLNESSAITASAARIPTAAGVLAHRNQRARLRRGTVKHRGYRDEFMDMNAVLDTGPSAVGERRITASSKGVGPTGSDGVTSKADAQPAGLASLSADRFGSRAASPMLPTTWDEGRNDNDTVAPCPGPTGERAQWCWYEPFQPQAPPMKQLISRSPCHTTPLT